MVLTYGETFKTVLRFSPILKHQTINLVSSPATIKSEVDKIGHIWPNWLKLFKIFKFRRLAKMTKVVHLYIQSNGTNKIANFWLFYGYFRLFHGSE